MIATLSIRGPDRSGISEEEAAQIAIDQDRAHAIRRCQAALAKVHWYRNVARSPGKFNMPDGSPVTPAYARTRARDFLNDAHAWRNAITAALRDGREVEPILSASIASLTHPGCPKGWKLVPEKITPEMAQRLESNYAECLPPSAVHAANWQAAWTAALAAAPSIPEGE